MLMMLSVHFRPLFMAVKIKMNFAIFLHSTVYSNVARSMSSDRFWILNKSHRSASTVLKIDCKYPCKVLEKY